MLSQGTIGSPACDSTVVKPYCDHYGACAEPLSCTRKCGRICCGSHQAESIRNHKHIRPTANPPGEHHLTAANRHHHVRIMHAWRRVGWQQSETSKAAAPDKAKVVCQACLGEACFIAGIIGAEALRSGCFCFHCNPRAVLRSMASSLMLPCLSPCSQPRPRVTPTPAAPAPPLQL